MSKTDSKPEPRKIVLSKLVDDAQELNTLWHKESQLVFKSSKEKLVIGRYVEKEFIPLDQDALDLCETWKFKYDESLVEAEAEEGSQPQPEADPEPEGEPEGSQPEVKVKSEPKAEKKSDPIVITPETAMALFTSAVSTEAANLIRFLNANQGSSKEVEAMSLRIKALSDENSTLKAKLSTLQAKIGSLLN